MIKTVIFDINETLLKLEELQSWFLQYFQDTTVSKYWFSKTLYICQVLNASNRYYDFDVVIKTTLKELSQELSIELKKKNIEEFLQTFYSLPADKDVKKTLQYLQKENIFIVALSNSSSNMLINQLKNAQIFSFFNAVYSVDEIQKYKPAREVYQHVLIKEKLNPLTTVMVATHDWDLVGAKNASLKTAYINRYKKNNNPLYPQVDFEGSNLFQLIRKFS